MKKLWFIANILLFGLAFPSCMENEKRNGGPETGVIAAADTSDQTNHFYDNADTYGLDLSEVEVLGEISNPGKVDFSHLPRHSVIVKETVLKDGKDQFIGAYRYDGYSLYDILNLRILDKKNKDEFNPIIDLFLEIENANGEKTVISWGEVYYPNHLHEILIADRVARIVPSKTKELWPLPTEARLVVGSDLITERNITSPIKIHVRSYPKTFKTVKGLDPVYSPEIRIYVENEPKATLTRLPEDIAPRTLHTVFYGRGRGIHSTQPFTGVLLREVLGKFIPGSQQDYREGLFVVVATDGYRSVYTYSEVFARNDQSEVLLIADPDDKRDGVFRLFPSCDFFSDRAVKGIREIHYSVNQK